MLACTGRVARTFTYSSVPLLNRRIRVIAASQGEVQIIGEKVQPKPAALLGFLEVGVPDSLLASGQSEHTPVNGRSEH